jgi:hypothetical protein
MPNKKIIGGIIAAVALFSVIALIPVFMYGFSVNATEVELGMTMGGSTSTSSISVSSIEVNQAPSFNPETSGEDVKQKAISAYEYLFSKFGGPASISEQSGTVGGNYVDIQITFNLTTPSNKSVVFEFSPQDLNAEGLKVSLLLGPDELEGEAGAFHLEITISIKITVTGFGTIVDETLTPVNLDFTVPAA